MHERPLLVDVEVNPESRSTAQDKAALGPPTFTGSLVTGTGLCRRQFGGLKERPTTEDVFCAYECTTHLVSVPSTSAPYETLDGSQRFADWRFLKAPMETSRSFVRGTLGLDHENGAGRAALPKGKKAMKVVLYN